MARGENTSGFKVKGAVTRQGKPQGVLKSVVRGKRPAKVMVTGNRGYFWNAPAGNRKQEHTLSAGGARLLARRATEPYPPSCQPARTLPPARGADTYHQPRTSAMQLNSHTGFAKSLTINQTGATDGAANCREIAMSFTLDTLADELGIPRETLSAKSDVVAKWNGYLSEADSKIQRP